MADAEVALEKSTASRGSLAVQYNVVYNILNPLYQRIYPDGKISVAAVFVRNLIGQTAASIEDMQ